MQSGDPGCNRVESVIADPYVRGGVTMGKTRRSWDRKVRPDTGETLNQVSTLVNTNECKGETHGDLGR